MTLSGLRELARAVHAELHRQSVLAMGRTAPNPPVAALVLGAQPGADHPTILASGGTEAAGQRHAEVVALDQIDSLDPLTSGHPGHANAQRMYVTLEPCSHHGRTPPCTQRILKALDAHGGPRRLIVYTDDPTLPASGVGQLRSAGLRVSLPGGPDAREFRAAYLDGFLARGAGEGPRLHFKAALSADGYMGLSDRRVMISNEHALRFGQLLRAKLDAILVGPGTTAIDRPSLTLRVPEKPPPSPHPDCAPIAIGEKRDPLFDAMLQHEREIFATAAENLAAYRPRRIFVLGRPFDGAREYFAGLVGSPVQIALAGSDFLGAWQAVFQTAGETQPTLAWSPALPVLPDPGDPAFGDELRQWLGSLGLNEVLVEGGAGLFRALESSVRSGDRIALLRSPRTMAGIVAGDGKPAPTGAIAAPAWLSESPLRAEYDLSGDRLELRQQDGQDIA